MSPLPAQVISLEERAERADAQLREVQLHIEAQQQLAAQVADLEATKAALQVCGAVRNTQSDLATAFAL